jgi:hypothetical protein
VEVCLDGYSGENTGSLSRQFGLDLGAGRCREDAERPPERGVRAGERGESGVIESRLCRRGWHLFPGNLFCSPAGPVQGLRVDVELRA